MLSPDTENRSTSPCLQGTERHVRECGTCTESLTPTCIHTYTAIKATLAGKMFRSDRYVALLEVMSSLRTQDIWLLHGNRKNYK